MSTQVSIAMAPEDEIDGHYSGPEHVKIYLGDVPVTMTHEQARQLYVKLGELV